MNTSKLVLIAATSLGALAVIIGAFGGHALKTILEQNDRVGTFETASRYHFYHAIALLIVGILFMNTPSKQLIYSSWSFVLGILFFSGSLYALSVTNYKILGAVAPIGGLFLVAGWILLLWHLLRSL